MMSKDNGGPAFPSDEIWTGSEAYGNLSQQHQGMTLRDYFAAKAMQGILSDETTVSSFDEAGKRELISPAVLVATAAYGMADAMLAERAK